MLERGMEQVFLTSLPQSCHCQAVCLFYFPSLGQKWTLLLLVRGVDHCSLCLSPAKDSLPWGQECLAWGSLGVEDREGKGWQSNPREPADTAVYTALTLHALGQAHTSSDDSTSTRLWVSLLQGKKDEAPGWRIRGTGPDLPLPQPQLRWSALLSHISHSLCDVVTNNHTSYSSKSSPVLPTQPLFHLWLPTCSLPRTLGLQFPPHPASIPLLSCTLLPTHLTPLRPSLSIIKPNSVLHAQS